MLTPIPVHENFDKSILERMKTKKRPRWQIAERPQNTTLS
jgi:hypothetical protein